MQYLFEKIDGSRVPVDANNVCMLMHTNKLEYVMRSSVLCVVRARGAKRKVEPRLKYGGHGNPRHPEGYRGN